MAASSVIEKIDSGKKEYRQLDEQRDKNMQVDEYFSSVVQDARGALLQIRTRASDARRETRKPPA
jgi:hypothetical protein